MARTTSIIGRLLLLVAIPAVLSLASFAPVGAQTLSQECTNPDVDYTVAFPTGWYVNGRVEGGELEDVAACRFFAPQDFEVQPQAGIAGIAVSIGAQSDGPPGALTPETSVGGKPAYVTETTVEQDGIEPAGTRHYDYWVELGPDAWLRAGTSDAPNVVGDYDENKAVLDAMMDSLTFGAETPGLPDTAMPAL
jgi:hypothetical protein